MLLKVKRPAPGRRSLPFQGQELAPGTEIDSRSFPAITQDKWVQLIHHGLFSLEGDDPGGATRRAVRERRDELGDPPQPTAEAPWVLPPELDSTLGPPEAAAEESAVCGECGFTAKDSHGLKVHRGRKHR